MNLPDKEKIHYFITSLKEANLSKVSYSRILHILYNELKSLPYTTAKLKAGHHIERARINKPGEIFYLLQRN